MVEKKPSRFMAVLFTVAAVGSLMTSLLLLMRANASGGLVALTLVASALLVVSAIGNWVTYFKKWVDFEIESRQESATTEQ